MIKDEKNTSKAKDEEIDQLNTYIQDCISANEELKDMIDYQLRLRGDLEFEQKAIADYCNELKRKFANIPATVNKTFILFRQKNMKEQ